MSQRLRTPLNAIIGFSKSSKTHSRSRRVRQREYAKLIHARAGSFSTS
jgi:signal transduction histidine kinase